MQVLVSRGANVFLEDRFGNNALNYAIAGGELVIARIMAGRRDIEDLMQFQESLERRIDQIPFTACGEAPIREGEFGGAALPKSGAKPLEQPPKKRF